jgi:hypothetical protein
MKPKLALACIAVLLTSGAVVLAGGWDHLWGKWEQKGNPKNYFLFSPTNVVASLNGTQEVWQVLGGTNLVMGLTVTRAGQKVEAKSTVKFNEMIFHLGQRAWLLRQAASKDPDFGGALPNQPAKPAPGQK